MWYTCLWLEDIHGAKPHGCGRTFCLGLQWNKNLSVQSIAPIFWNCCLRIKWRKINIMSLHSLVGFCCSLLYQKFFSVSPKYKHTHIYVRHVWSTKFCSRNHWCNHGKRIIGINTGQKPKTLYCAFILKFYYKCFYTDDWKQQNFKTLPFDWWFKLL